MTNLTIIFTEFIHKNVWKCLKKQGYGGRLLSWEYSLCLAIHQELCHFPAQRSLRKKKMICWYLLQSHQREKIYDNYLWWEDKTKHNFSFITRFKTKSKCVGISKNRSRDKKKRLRGRWWRRRIGVGTYVLPSRVHRRIERRKQEECCCLWGRRRRISSSSSSSSSSSAGPRIIIIKRKPEIRKRLINKEVSEKCDKYPSSSVLVIFFISRNAPVRPTMFPGFNTVIDYSEWYTKAAPKQREWIEKTYNHYYDLMVIH